MQGCSREDGSRMDAGGEGGNGGMHGQMDIYDFMGERKKTGLRIRRGMAGRCLHGCSAG